MLTFIGLLHANTNTYTLGHNPRDIYFAFFTVAQNGPCEVEYFQITAFHHSAHMH